MAMGNTVSHCANAQLLNDVLDMEKVDKGRLAFAPAPCDAVAVMSGCARDLREAALMRGVTLTFVALESRDAALGALYRGPWKGVVPRRLPHEGTTQPQHAVSPVCATPSVALRHAWRVVPSFVCDCAFECDTQALSTLPSTCSRWVSARSCRPGLAAAGI